MPTITRADLRPTRHLALLLMLGLGGMAGWLVAAIPRSQTGAELRFAPDQSRLADSPELRTALAASPFALFRFVNEPWTRATCAALASSLRSAPTVRLHGDAHLEQYALTLDARGLDDFDDAARGPAAVDLVRFAGSIELAARWRRWDAASPAALDAFFEGYRRGLTDPGFLPADPAVVVRMRAAITSGPATFVNWADSLMRPLSAEERARLDWKRLEESAAGVDPVFTPEFLGLKKIGWLRMGIGSALDAKLLARVEGPSAALEDDLVVEAKQVRSHMTVACGDGAHTDEPFRIVSAVRQLGRLRPGLLVAVPRREEDGDVRAWWVRAWDPSYREIAVDDLDSPGELREVAFDVGVQLGSANIAALDADDARRARTREREELDRREARIRLVAHELTVELLDAWKRMR